ncbi:MAG: hypothetical protein WC966_08785 [Bradymonadales bacterium]
MRSASSIQIKSLRIQETSHSVLLAPSLRNVILGAQANFAKAIILSLLVMLFLYVPDFIFDYSQRGSKILKGFGIYLLVILVIIGLIAFVVSIIESSACYIDQKARSIHAGKNNRARQTKFRDISKIYVEPSFLFGSKRICVKVGEETRVLLRIFATYEEAEQLREYLQKLCI